MSDTSGQPRDRGTAAFTLTLRAEDGDTATLVLAGELDIASVARLGEALDQALAAGHRRVRADLAELSFCGAAGITALAQARRTLAEMGGSLRLDQVPANIKQSLILADAEWLLD